MNNVTATEAWINSIKQVVLIGNDHFPRGTHTKEMLNQSICFDMNYPICHHDQRNLSYKFMAAEAYWITSGSMFVDDIAPYNAHISQYSDDGYIFNGAYGPAFLNQLNYVVKTLEGDRGSRQACMTIWHPNPQRTKDYKCTIALIFNVRHNVMYTTVLMRSNDLILGRPYDMFNFTLMTLKILTELNRNTNRHDPIRLGNLFLHAASAHIYKDKFDMVEEILANEDSYKATTRVPVEAMVNWGFVTESLLCCRDHTIPEMPSYWDIRP